MNQVDWSKFLDLQYWTEGIAGGSAVTPVVESGSLFFWFFTGLFTFLFAKGVFMITAQKFLDYQNPLNEKLSVWGNNYVWMGILGIVWFLLRQIEVGFLGSRIWLLVGLVWFLVILALVIRYFVAYFPLEWAYYKKNKRLRA